jgi:uncharacterized protein YecE (DUF72 family)
MKSRTLNGLSGWRYALWRGKFYPGDMRQKAELAFAAEWSGQS